VCKVCKRGGPEKCGQSMIILSFYINVFSLSENNIKLLSSLSMMTIIIYLYEITTHFGTIFFSIYYYEYLLLYLIQNQDDCVQHVFTFFLNCTSISGVIFVLLLLKWILFSKMTLPATFSS